MGVGLTIGMDNRWSCPLTYNRYRDFKRLVEMYNYGRWYDPEIEKLRVQLSRDEH